MSITAVKRFAAAFMALAVIGLTGCDSSTGVDGEGDVTFQGRVTDDSGFSKSAGSQANIEGAVVTAANVTADGSLNQLEGEATTNAEGRFNLAVDNATEEVVIVAQKADFESRAMVYTRGRSSVETMPLTVESHAEANVFVEARDQDDEDEVTMADVAAYVTSEVAADVRSGNRSAGNVAASIVADVKARSEFVRDEEGDDEADDAQENQNEAFFQLQADLNASANSEAEAAAIHAFEEALVEAYADAGVSFETQAKARSAGRAALDAFGSTSFEMKKKATLLASMANAHAVEASFHASGASSARLSALAQARETLVAEIRAASSTSALAEARSNYEASVEAELAAEANIEQSVLTTTTSTAIAAAKTALTLALTTAGSAEAFATAYAEFYAAAESSAKTSLDGSTAKADLAAKVMTMLSASS